MGWGYLKILVLHCRRCKSCLEFFYMLCFGFFSGEYIRVIERACWRYVRVYMSSREGWKVIKWIWAQRKGCSVISSGLRRYVEAIGDKFDDVTDMSLPVQYIITGNTHDLGTAHHLEDNCPRSWYFAECYWSSLAWYPSVHFGCIDGDIICYGSLVKFVDDILNLAKTSTGDVNVNCNCEVVDILPAGVYVSHSAIDQ